MKRPTLTRRSVITGLTLAATSAALLAHANKSGRAGGASRTRREPYERLGGVFAIAAVVDHFSDALIKNPIVGQEARNPQLREWHTKSLERLPGLKFMRMPTCSSSMTSSLPVAG